MRSAENSFKIQTSDPQEIMYLLQKVGKIRDFLLSYQMVTGTIFDRIISVDLNVTYFVSGFGTLEKNNKTWCIFDGTIEAGQAEPIKIKVWSGDHDGMSNRPGNSAEPCAEYFLSDEYGGGVSPGEFLI